MATTDQLVIKAKLILSRVNSTALDATIINELGLAQERLEREAWLPSFLYNTGLSGSLTSKDQDLKLLFPRFLRLHREAGGVFVYDVNSSFDGEPYKKLRRYDDADQLLQRFPGDLGVGSFVQGYFMADTLIELRPRPSVNVPARIFVKFYESEPVLPLAGNSNLWTQKASDYLLGEAGVIIAQSLRDTAAMQIFQKIRDDDKARMYKMDVAQMEDDLERTMGDEN